MNGAGLVNAGLANRQQRRAQETKAKRAQASSTLLDMGVAHAHAGRAAMAEKYFRQAAREPGTAALAWLNLGVLAHRMGELVQAEQRLRRALAIDPRHGAILLSLATVCSDLGKAAEAAALRAQAQAQSPQAGGVFHLRAQEAADANHLMAAIDLYRQAIEREPDNPTYWYDLSHAHLCAGDVEQAIALRAHCLTLPGAQASMHSGYLGALHYRATSNDRLYQELCAWGARWCPEPRSRASFANQLDPERRLRIGYLSPDFNQGPVGRLFYPAVQHADCASFELFGYSDTTRPDAVSAAFQQRMSQWRDCSATGSEALASLIEADRIDILVDLAGHCADSRLQMLGRRVAPVQVSAVGWFNSTGVAAMDAILADPVSIRPEEEKFYCEQVIRLPHARFCYAIGGNVPEVAPLPALSKGRICFGSFNNIVKLTPEVMALWARIVMAVPGSQLLLQWRYLEDEAMARVCLGRFAEAGLAADRIRLRGLSSLPDMFEDYKDVDIALDPFPFTGGVTSCDALWMGAPVVTCPGDSLVSRQTASFLTCIGLEELIARDLAHYGEIAVALAQDLPRLARLRHTLRPRMMASGLCDGPGYARALEAAYRLLWRQYCCLDKSPESKKARLA